MRVVLGKDLGKQANARRLRVIEAKPHPNFSGGSDGYANDVAVLELEVPTTGGRATLATSAKVNAAVAAQADATVLGWGYDVTTISSELKYGFVRLADMDDCNAVYESPANPARAICTNAAVSQPCGGDSGGPLVAGKGPDNGQVLVLGIMMRSATDCIGYKGRALYTRLDDPSVNAFLVTEFKRICSKYGKDSEPPRLSRRLVGLSHAVTTDSVDCEL